MHIHFICWSQFKTSFSINIWRNSLVVLAWVKFTPWGPQKCWCFNFCRMCFSLAQGPEICHIRFLEISIFSGKVTCFAWNNAWLSKPHYDMHTRMIKSFLRWIYFIKNSLFPWCKPSGSSLSNQRLFVFYFLFFWSPPFFWFISASCLPPTLILFLRKALITAPGCDVGVLGVNVLTSGLVPARNA